MIAAWLFAAALLAAEQPVIIDCVFPDVGPPCNEAEPETRWEYPSCADYKMNTSLIEAAEKRDRSAIALLESRWASTVSWQERARIGGALLGRVADDEAIWKELETHAANLLRFSEPGDETAATYEAYCAEHGYEPEKYLEATWYFFDAVATDRRSRPLLLRALALEDGNLLTFAVYGLAEQREESALPLIEKALEKSKNPSELAEMLVFYQSEAADRLAMRFITDEDDLEQYRQRRQQP
jgi:hypothetical protein